MRLKPLGKNVSTGGGFWCTECESLCYKREPAVGILSYRRELEMHCQCHTHGFIEGGYPTFWEECEVSIHLLRQVTIEIEGETFDLQKEIIEGCCEGCHFFQAGDCYVPGTPDTQCLNGIFILHKPGEIDG